VNNTITYEFPLHERIRVFIRLEQLFQQFLYLADGKTVADKRSAITVLLDIISIFKRNDLKSEIIKELDRQALTLNKIANNEGVDKSKLEKILDELNQISRNLHAVNGKIGINIPVSDLFQSIAQRSSIPGGTCCFDLPEYHYWLAQDESIRLKDLKYWSNPFIDVYTAIEFILNFIRNSQAAKNEIAIAGFYQVSLDQNQPFQLIKVTLEKSLPLFVEISGGKHRCNIRFMEPSIENKRSIQSINDIPFTLTCCLF
jgi:cell division protein ZapD